VTIEKQNYYDVVGWAIIVHYLPWFHLWRHAMTSLLSRYKWWHWRLAWLGNNDKFFLSQKV